MNWYKRQLKIAMPAVTQFSHDEISTVGQLVSEGYPFAQIANLLGVAPKVIFRLNNEYKWRDLKKEQREKDQKILDLYLLPPDGEGLTAAEIRERTGIGLLTIKNTLRRLDLEDKIRSVSDEGRRRFQKPEEIKKQRDRMKRFYEDNPEAAQEHSRKMIEWWNQFDLGEGKKFENRLLSYPTRQQAINNLRGFMGKEYNVDAQRANALYTKYKKIIDSHTYPDEMLQQPVTASMNWYKRHILSQTYEQVMDNPEMYSDPDEPDHFDSQRYFSIGQSEDTEEDSYCWIFNGRSIEVKQGGTHAMNFPHLFSWDKEVAPYIYRGWYDPSQKMISVVIPRVEGQVDLPLEPSSLPTKVRVALGDRFGNDNEIVVF